MAKQYTIVNQKNISHNKGGDYMTDNELLLAMSDMLDKKLKPVNDRLKKIELTQENDILPRLQNIEACYTCTYKRYQISHK